MSKVDALGERAEIDWEKVVSAILMEVDYDIWKEYFNEPDEDMESSLLRIIRIARLAAGEDLE